MVRTLPLRITSGSLMSYGYAPSYATSYAPSYAPSYATSYTPSYAASAYTDGSYYGQQLATGQVSERMYFNLNGKLVRSYKNRNFRNAQKQVLDLFPEALQGIASSRIQFYVMRPGYHRNRYVNFKSYISKQAWALEMDSLAEHDSVGIDVRESISVTESVSSFFNRSRFF